MKTINYEFATGETKQIQVSDELYEISKELDRQRYNNDHANTRRHNSIDVLSQYDLEPAYEPDLLRMAEVAKLETVLLLLDPEQRHLIQRIFFNKESLIDVANSDGVAYQSIQKRLNRAKARLKKLILEN